MPYLNKCFPSPVLYKKFVKMRKLTFFPSALSQQVLSISCTILKIVKLNRLILCPSFLSPQKRLHTIETVDETLFGFMPECGTIDAVFILRRLQEEYYAK